MQHFNCLRMHWPSFCFPVRILAVLYDDGDTENLDLSQEKYELVPETGNKKSAKRLKRTPKQPAVPSSADGLEDSDVDCGDAYVSEDGSEFAASEDEEDEDEMADLEDSSDDDMSGMETEEEDKVSQKLSSKTRSKPQNKKPAKQQSPSENVNRSNGDGLKASTPASAKPASMLASDRTPKVLAQRPSNGLSATQTPCTGQLHSRLSAATPGTAQTDGRSALGTKLFTEVLHAWLCSWQPFNSLPCMLCSLATMAGPCGHPPKDFATIISKGADKLLAPCFPGLLP